MERSPLQNARYSYEPKLPPVLRDTLTNITVQLGEPTEATSDQSGLKQAFPLTYGAPIASFTPADSTRDIKPLKVGVVLSGGQAPGGHNVIVGLLDALKSANSESRLYGFLGGPGGILENQVIELTPKFVEEYRNTGGFDMIGSGRTKIETEEQFDTSLQVCTKRELDAVVIIGGDDSNTNAALLAEYFRSKDADVRVIGVPKTIDRDLKNEYIETSFGFDTATKTYAELIGNIARDASSARKYWHFIKLMGRSASHIALECALQTHPNGCIISEEVAEKQQTLDDLVDRIVEQVVTRSKNGEDFGVFLVPEGLIEFIPEMKGMISELNRILAHDAAYFQTLHTYEDQSEWINRKLSRDASHVFSSLPNEIQRQLLMDRDPHGNVQVSRIETEKLLIDMVESRLNEMKATGRFNGKFSAMRHFFGYEGRCAFPSNFDADYCYTLGYTACALIANGLTGYVTSVQNLARPAQEWEPAGVPLTMFMNLEQRAGQLKPVIRKALVELSDTPFRTFAAHRAEWEVKTSYRFPGAIQYYGPPEVCDKPTLTLEMEHSS
ncbi:MAG: diphosphate--fructose-6-phosphate 1-phosphotransferase [Spirochaetes bacterium]|jgi:pyrophosphate--fructose-6-phosphate 1-phosphotransferase|nr:diphosphate--fructose-6-phosphate 1-phosphotransferase [Spirochaetota bacterium]